MRGKPGEWTAMVLTNRHRAGPFHQLSLSLPGRFPLPRAGAFLMLSVGREPEILLRRPMAFYDAIPGRGKIRVEILYAVVGRGTERMRALRPKAEVSLLGPLGNAFGHPRNGERVAIVAGGVGIAPFLLWGRQIRPAVRRNVRLMVGFSNPEQVRIASDFSRVHLRPITAVEGHGGDFCGTAVELLLHEMETETFDRILTCGPERMMEKVIAIAAERQIPCEVSLEARMGCGLGLCLNCVTSSGAGNDTKGRALVCRDGPIFTR